MKSINIILILISLPFLKEIEFNTCSDYFEKELKSSCEKFNPGDSYGCQYLYGKCFSKKDICTEEADEQQCPGLIPNNPLYKCSYINSRCTQVPKECSDYIEGETDCMSLSAGDSSKICTLKNGNCVPTQKICSEFTSGVEDSDFCSKLQASNVDKICLYSSEKKGCVEKYKECQYYERNTFVDDRNKEECESIEYYNNSIGKFDQSYKCVFDSDKNSCKREKKQCSDITDKDFCFNYDLYENLYKYDKRCVYIGGQCEEQYEDCFYADYRECSSVTIFNGQ